MNDLLFSNLFFFLKQFYTECTYKVHLHLHWHLNVLFVFNIYSYFHILFSYLKCSISTLFYCLCTAICMWMCQSNGDLIWMEACGWWYMNRWLDATLNCIDFMIIWQLIFAKKKISIKCSVPHHFHWKLDWVWGFNDNLCKNS